MKKAKSRLPLTLIQKKVRRLKISSSFLAVLVIIYLAQKIIMNAYVFHPVESLANNDFHVVTVEKQVEVIKEVEVDRQFKTEKQQILAYLVEKFGDKADAAITMIRTCENSTFDPERVSPLNVQKSGRRSYDVGVMQINVDEHNTDELEKLKDWKYNIDRGYAKFKARGDKFTDWTCATVIGEKNYLGK